MSYRVFLLTLKANKRVFKNKNKIYFFNPSELSKNDYNIYSRIPYNRRFFIESFKDKDCIKELKKRSL